MLSTIKGVAVGLVVGAVVGFSVAYKIYSTNIDSLTATINAYRSAEAENKVRRERVASEHDTLDGAADAIIKDIDARAPDSVCKLSPDDAERLRAIK